MQRFNIALFADDVQLRETCVQLAQENFARYADQYLLGENALPHITLNQFLSEPERLPEIWQAVKDLRLEPMQIKFTHIYALPNEGATWFGLAVEPKAELLSLQKAVFDKLQKLNIEGFTGVRTYFPHLTWARVKTNDPIALSAFQLQDLWQKEHSFSLSLGRSTDHGVYLEQLY